MSSWTFSLASQVLAEADTALLSPEGEGTDGPANGLASRLKRPEFGFAMGANTYPSRTSSLARPASKAQQGASGGDSTKVQEKPGLVELAAYRAELVMIKRRTLEHLAEKRSWVAGWNSSATAAKELEDVDLEDEEEDEEAKEDNDDEEELSDEKDQTSTDKAAEPAPSLLLTPHLTSALTNLSTFLTAFEDLSALAVRLYTTATHSKSAETIMGDIAMLKFQQQDFTAAARFFEYVLPLYASDAWSLQEAIVVKNLSECLKRLNRKGDFAQVLLGYLKKIAGRRIEGRRRSQDEEESALGYLNQLVQASADLPNDLDAKMSEFFDNIELGREIALLEDRDGFSYRFSFRHVLDDEVALDEVSIKLVRVDDPQTDIMVTRKAPLDIETGVVQVELESNATTFGAYYIDKVILKAKKLRFCHDLRPPTIPETSALGIVYAPSGDEERSQRERPFVLLYPNVRAFDATVQLAKNVHMEKTKHLEVKLGSGWNDIKEMDLRLKPASAGLRLFLGDAKATGCEKRREKEAKPGVLALGGLKADEEATVQIPYSMDNVISRIIIRLEARYSTAAGDFSFTVAVKLPVVLPLDVEVNDLFHQEVLFSTFTVRSTNQCPFAVTSATLKESKAYAVEEPPVSVLPTMVIDNAPVSLIYKIARKASEEGAAKVAKKDAALSLAVTYQSVEELIMTSLTSKFASDLEGSDFKHLRRLLLPVLDERTRQRVLPSEMDTAALLGEAKVPSFADLGWFEIVDTLPLVLQRALNDWLMKWHIENSRVEIDLPTGATDADKCISLAVEVPNVDAAFSVSVSLLEPGLAGLSASEHVVKVGQPMKAELRINYTKAWSAANVHGIQQGEKDEKRNGFFLDVQAEPDIWLIGGPKKKYFSLPSTADSASDQVILVPIVLVPLKLGSHPLPQLDVQAAAATDEGNAAGSRQMPASCETFCESAGVVVTVVRGSQHSRVRIVEGGEAV